RRAQDAPAPQAPDRREAPYRAIFEASLDGLFLWDETPRLVDVNPAGLALYGYRREDIVGQTYPPSMPAEYVDSRLVMVRRALAGHATHLETTVLRPDGSTFEADLRVLPFVHRDRPHALTVLRDITERRQREGALRNSEEQYRAIFNASMDALVLRDAESRAVEVNPAYTALSGYTREEVLAAGSLLAQADPALVGARHRAEHQLALGGTPVSFQATARRKDGTELQVEVRGTPMTYRGQPHVLYASRDITERMAAEQRRRDLERELRQAQKMEAIGQLTGGVAHDFNNILTSVLGYVAMAQEGPAAGADPVLARQLAQARLAAERAREHVAQLLAFSRPHRGERRRLAPAQLTLEVLQLLRPNLPSSIEVDCAACRNAQPALPHVLVDPVQFEQVLVNLLLNARDAIGGQGTIRVQVACAPATGPCASCGTWLDGRTWVGFEVADTGHGMAPDVLERMFEPFFTTKPVGRGTGMGLAMAHGIVHDHGGHLQVQSAQGHGSTFRVLLPPAPRVPCLDDAAEQEPAAAGPRGQLRGRVLLVEAEALVSGFMQDLLHGWGLDVVVEHEPAAAVRRLADAGEPLAALLTDQTMPGMTGLALARRARQHRPGLPVLLYTGNAADLDAAEVASCGVAALLRKPLDVAVLRQHLAEVLGPAASAT
ncbi:MAG: hybrid sensor histidine kinase/response regulator, partial [Ramlibacter sp.]